MVKDTVKLTENELKRIISESVKRVLNEEGFYADELYGLGASFENGQQGPSSDGPWWMGSFLNFEKRVNSGKYDKYIFDDEWVEDFIDEEYPNSSREREMMEKCISNRRYEVRNSRRSVVNENRMFNVQDNLLESFDELKGALMEIRGEYSFDAYLENLSSAIQSACRVINELNALYNNR